MADPNRGNDICSFFIYDHSVLKREEDDLKDAIVYFWPHTVSIDNQCALVGKLIGISDFFFNTLPESAPKVIKLQSEKFATRREGNFTISLGCDLFIRDSFITHHLDFVWNVFIFFQGSLPAVKQRCKSHQAFPGELAKVWDFYLPVCQVYGDLLSQAFQILPDVQLPKSSCKTFLHASHILQRSHRQPGVLGGAILYKSKVLCTQLSPDITKRFLLLRPQQSHLPCQEVKTEFELPGGMRLIKVYLSSEEYNALSSRRHHSLKSKAKHSSDHTKLYYSNTQPSPDVTSVPSVQCDSAKLTPPIHDLVQRILTGGAEEFDDSESLDTKYNQTRAEVKSEEKMEPPESFEKRASACSGEITHLSDTLENVSLDGDVNDGVSAIMSSSKKSLGEDIIRVNGIRKSFSESEVEIKSVDEQGNQDFSVTDSGSVGATGEGADKKSKEMYSSEQTQELKHESLTKESSDECETKTVHDSEIASGEKYPSDVDYESVAVHEKKSEDDGMDSLEITADTCQIVSADMDKGSVRECDKTDGSEDTSDDRVDSVKESEQGTDSGVSETNVEGAISDAFKHDGASVDTQNDTKTQNEDKEGTHLTVSSETGGANSPKSVTPSNFALIDTNQEHSADEVTDTSDKGLGTQCDQTQSDSVTGGDSETDAVSPLLKSHDDRHLVLSGGTVSSASDDVMSSHKETLDFSEDINNKTLDSSASGGWTVKTPEAVKEKNFLPSSESYVSSSYSHSESETSESWIAERDGLIDLTLYVQGHSEMLLLLLLDNGVKCDKTLVSELWKCSLAHLAELDYEVKESLESINTDEFSVGNYYFLRYDSFTRNVSGNVLKSVTATAHEFLTTSTNMHGDFQQHDNMTDILLRSHSSSVYGRRSVCHETFFQLNAPQRHFGGYPQPKDIAFTLDQLAAQKLHADHDVTLL